jgi:hypothetical protein
MDEEAAGPLDDPGYHIYLATGYKKYAETLFSLPFALAVNTINSMGNWFVNVFTGNAEMEPVAEVNFFAMPLDSITSSENSIKLPFQTTMEIGPLGIGPYAEIYFPNDNLNLEANMDLGFECGMKAELGTLMPIAEAKLGMQVEASTTEGPFGTFQGGNFGFNLRDEYNHKIIYQYYQILKGNWMSY